MWMDARRAVHAARNAEETTGHESDRKGYSNLTVYIPLVRSAMLSCGCTRREGRAWQAISDSVEQRICECDGRDFKDSAFFKKEWGPSKCRRAYLAHKRVLEEEMARDGRDPVSDEFLANLPWPV